MALHRNSGPNVFQRDTASPSSTTTSAAATSSSSNGNEGLSITGSPPLIVAFLAVGLFMAAMLTIFGWRRMVFGRFLLQPTVVDGFYAPRMAESYGEKPELWDLWTEPSVGINEQLTWERIMPFSASIKQSEEDTHLRNPSQLQSIQQQIRRHTRSAKATDDGSTQSRTLQVAVAIAMPSPHTLERESTNEGPTSADTHTHEHNDARPTLDYSLGLMEMPWHSEEQ